MSLCVVKCVRYKNEINWLHSILQANRMLKVSAVSFCCVMVTGFMISEDAGSFLNCGRQK